MRISFILISLTALLSIDNAAALNLKNESQQEGLNDNLIQVQTGNEAEAEGEGEAQGEAEAGSEMIPPSMITDVIKAIKGPPKAPNGPVDQYAPAINIVRSSRNLYAPANAFPGGP